MAFFNKNRILSFILTFIIFLASPFTNFFSFNANAATGTLSVWRSTGIEIGRWYNFPSRIFVTKLNNNDDGFPFKLGMRHAISEWNSALNTSISYYYSSDYISEADIHYLGGTKSQIIITGRFTQYDFTLAENMHGTTAGYTYSTKSEQDIWYYGDEVKTGYIINYSKGFVVDFERTLTDTSRYKYYNVCTHELGHALGWLDHSTMNTDVMYRYSNIYHTLSSTEEQHLKQVYDLA